MKLTGKEKVKLKLYTAYLDNKGCRLSIPEVEALISEYGDSWNLVFEKNEREAMKELL